MNYELAKELKEAGFPHNWCSEDDCSCLTTEGMGRDKNGCYPTLSELVKETTEYMLTHGEGMDGFSFHLQGVQIEKSPQFWRASNMSFYQADKEMGENDDTGTGTTPEEAVARLWLYLKKP